MREAELSTREAILGAANERAERLENLLHTRGADIERLRARDEALDVQAHELRSKLDAATEAHRPMDERCCASTPRRFITFRYLGTMLVPFLIRLYRR